MSKKLSTRCLLALVRGLEVLPLPLNNLLTRLLAFFIDRAKGDVARAAIRLALPDADTQTVNSIAKQAAYHGCSYVLSLPRLHNIPYQLHDLDVILKALEQNNGLIIASLHMAPPDIGTLALTREGVKVSTVIGAGNQKPWLNEIGQYILNKSKISFVQRGSPMAVLKTLRRKEAIVLHSDMRSREAPVTFFGQETKAPVSAINTALMLKTPIIFHYCTLKNNVWQLQFEPFEMADAVNRKEAAQQSLQLLIHRMETVIRENPKLWIWHYDRFKLKKKLRGRSDK